jgi:hypothetical protein
MPERVTPINGSSLGCRQRPGVTGRGSQALELDSQGDQGLRPAVPPPRRGPCDDKRRSRLARDARTTTPPRWRRGLRHLGVGGEHLELRQKSTTGFGWRHSQADGFDATQTMKNDAEVRQSCAASQQQKDSSEPRRSRLQATAEQPSPRRGTQSPRRQHRLFKGRERRHAKANASPRRDAKPLARANALSSAPAQAGRRGKVPTGPTAAGKGTFGRHELRGRVPSGPTTTGKGTFGRHKPRGRAPPGTTNRRPSDRPRPSGHGQPDTASPAHRQQARRRRVSSETRQSRQDRRLRASARATDRDAPGPSGPDNSRRQPSNCPRAANGPAGKSQPLGAGRRSDARCTKGCQSGPPLGAERSGTPIPRPVLARPSGHKGASPQASPGATLGSQRSQPAGQSRRDPGHEGASHRPVLARPSGHKGTSHRPAPARPSGHKRTS